MSDMREIPETEPEGLYMKVLSITGSGRAGGNTETAAGLLECAITKAAADAGAEAEIERVRLSAQPLGICRGCRLCFDRSEDACPLQDEALAIFERMHKADVILLGSPVYVEDVSGTVKNWIDRMAYNCHRPGLPGKIAFVYTTAGMGSSGHALRTMKTAFGTWGMTVVGSMKVRMGARMPATETESAYAGRMDKEAREIIRVWMRGKICRPSFYSLLAFRVQQRCWRKEKELESTADGRFWLQKGWLERKCCYYVPYRANPLKRMAARGLGWLVALFLS